MSADLGEVWFYHLEHSSLEATLPPLLERCVQRGWRAIVRGGVPERLEALDAALWTYKDESFLAHGLDGKGRPERQPILLTTKLGRPNGAQALFLIDGATPQPSESFARTCFVFDGRDKTAVAEAREHWRVLKGEGRTLSYWKEAAEGRWEKQA